MSTAARNPLGAEVRPVTGALGAEIRGISLRHLDAETVRAVRDLLHEHLALFFPDQHLSVDDHQRLGEALGEVSANAFIPSVDSDHPGVSIHRSEDGYVADVWHSDGQNRPAPVAVTILKMVTAPVRGGDTMWANQYAVYESLSMPMRHLLDGITALQRSGLNPSEETTHPAVIVHPVTGRRLLYVSRHHTVRFLELSVGESRALLDFLAAFAVQPEFVCRYRWAEGTVGMWDNLATQHYGVNDFTEPRVFHRVMVAGPVLASRVDHWPSAEDVSPRTMVVKGGGEAVVGSITTGLWSREDRPLGVAHDSRTEPGEG
jgi:taurine dioxygenase